MEKRSIYWTKAPTTALLFGITAICPALCPHALADSTLPPARIANIYAGLNHQPKPAEVEGRERAAGLEPSVRQRSQDDAVLRDLYEELIGKAGTG